MFNVERNPLSTVVVLCFHEVQKVLLVLALVTRHLSRTVIRVGLPFVETLIGSEVRLEVFIDAVVSELWVLFEP
ncbi:hypothetical protein D3C86_2040760 [compost metagenome]